MKVSRAAPAESPRRPASLCKPWMPSISITPQAHGRAAVLCYETRRRGMIGMKDIDSRAGFEKEGTEVVRRRLSRSDGDGGYQDGAQRGAAIKWLARKDEASKAEQIEIARSARDASTTANKLAAIALGVAIGALIISIISLVRSFP